MYSFAGIWRGGGGGCQNSLIQVVDTENDDSAQISSSVSAEAKSLYEDKISSDQLGQAEWDSFGLYMLLLHPDKLMANLDALFRLSRSTD